jgi:hypothetical protein
LTCKFNPISTPQDVTDFYEKIDYAVDSGNRIVAITAPAWFKQYMGMVFGSGTSSIIVAEPSIAPVYFGISTEQHVMKPELHLLASKLRESGILAHLMKNYLFRDEMNEKPREIGPQVLTLGHLRAGFIICIVMWSLSALAFIFEYSVRIWKKLFTLCVSSYVAVKFTKMNKTI